MSNMSEEKLYKCTKCMKMLPAGSFWPERRSNMKYRDYLHTWCKICDNEHEKRLKRMNNYNYDDLDDQARKQLRNLLRALEHRRREKQKNGDDSPVYLTKEEKNAFDVLTSVIRITKEKKTSTPDKEFDKMLKEVMRVTPVEEDKTE